MIVTAVIIEATPLARVLGLARCSATHWAGPAAHLHVAGIRAIHLSSAMLPPKCDGIILCGLAGALDPELMVGDVLLDSTSDNIPMPPPCRVGTILCTGEIAATPRAKAELFRRTGSAAVEMEADVVRKLARENHLPFLHVRAISDTAAESLNPSVMGLVDSVGRPKPLAVGRTLLRQPGLIPELNRLRQASNRATKSLATIVGAIVASGWAGPTE